MTISLVFSIILNTIIGTLPFLGPIISGFLISLVIGERDLAMVGSFLGAIIGGGFCRVLLLFPNNFWHENLLNLFGHPIGKIIEILIKGNSFFLVLYFGLFGLIGGFVGVLTFKKIRILRK